VERIEYVPWKRRLESGNVVEGPPEESAAVDVFRPGKLGANIPFEVPFNDTFLIKTADFCVERVRGF